MCLTDVPSTDPSCVPQKCLFTEMLPQKKPIAKSERAVAKKQHRLLLLLLKYTCHTPARAPAYAFSFVHQHGLLPMLCPATLAAQPPAQAAPQTGPRPGHNPRPATICLLTKPKPMGPSQRPCGSPADRAGCMHVAQGNAQNSDRNFPYVPH